MAESQWSAKVEEIDGAFAITVYVTKELHEDLCSLVGISAVEIIGELQTVLGEEAVQALEMYLMQKAMKKENNG